MANFRFEIGQKVVIHGCVTHAYCNGHVSKIVAREFRHKVRNRTTGELLTNVNIYRLAEIPAPLTCVREQNLAPYDPPGSWEDCAWRPKEIKA